MIPKKFKKIKTLVLLAGPGSGSKLFQSFIDGHHQILMTPGYILMYFYPHWNKYLKNYNNWAKVVNHFLKLHPSIINASKLKGGDYLYNLGKTKTKSVKVDKKNFIKILNNYLKDEEINSKNFFIAIHLAYANCLSENIKQKKILIYHMHVCWYIDDFYQDFKDAKTITMLRELKSNIPKRIPALEKPNEMHLNKTDSIFFKTRSYKNIIFEDFFSLDYLKRFQNKSHRVIKHEDLITRKKSIMKNFCNYTSTSYSPSLLKSTINNLTWNYKYDNKVELKNGVAKHILDYDKKNFFNYELFWLNNLIKQFNKTYSYKINNGNKTNFLGINIILSFLFIFLPSKKELSLFLTFFSFKFFNTYMKTLYQEAFKIKLKQYEKNAFYFHKWSNKNYPFKALNFLNVRINKKKKCHMEYFFYIIEIINVCIYTVSNYFGIYFKNSYLFKNLFQKCFRFKIFSKKIIR